MDAIIAIIAIAPVIAVLGIAYGKSKENGTRWGEEIRNIIAFWKRG